MTQENCRFTPEFCDRLIARLKAGEDPEKLRAELGVGADTMRRYVAMAKVRVAI